MYGQGRDAGPPPGSRYRRHLAEQPRPEPKPADPFSSGSDDAAEGGPGPWFEADHEGRCSACDEYHIQPWDRIRADGSGGYEHEDCASD